EAEGRSAVVRLKMPREGKLALDDLVRGRVEFDWATEQDHVVRRADGSFIYHLANVVDDQDFEITHVIRAEEHLSNTPRQVFMIRSLGYRLPAYAHLPFVAEPGSKTKLSKRKLDKYLKNNDFKKLLEHGEKIAAKMGLSLERDTFNPVIVDFYKSVGYLPEAIVNAMAMVGWALDDKTELFLKPADLVEGFSLEKVTRGAASFDPAKLFSFEEKHMQHRSVEEKYLLCKPFLVNAPFGPDTALDVRKLLRFAGDRVKVAGDILDFDEFFVGDEDMSYDPTALQKRILDAPDAKPLLTEFAERLRSQDDWSHEALHQLMERFLEEKQITAARIIHALRVAATGKATGIGMFEAMELLGKESTLNRLERALKIDRA
ncbi:MAG TPA: glutamate--tRNA ligase, partial [Planctomycetaceae bacterium]|nr:glutamate--tRNA ligase [Planctomycetaceae bacterium]